MTTQPTCADRIGAHRDSRMRDFGALRDLAEAHSPAALAEALEDSATRELFAELTADAAYNLTGDDPAQSVDLDAVRERAEERMHEYPLAVSSRVVFRIDLSTGGPGDWLELQCSGDTPLYEPAGDGEHFYVERITYHFNDWYDHAAVELDGHDYEVAEAFAQCVVPELIG